MSTDTFVLVHRIELAANSGRPEETVPYLFEDEADAILFANTLMRDTTKRWGWAPEAQDEEADYLATDLENASRTAASVNDMHASHVVHLTDRSDEVFELYRRGTAPKGHLYPEAGK